MRMDNCDGGCTWDAVRKYTHLHSMIECAVCGAEEIVPTPDDMKPEVNWDVATSSDEERQ